MISILVACWVSLPTDVHVPVLVLIISYRLIENEKDLQNPKLWNSLTASGFLKFQLRKRFFICIPNMSRKPMTLWKIMEMVYTVRSLRANCPFPGGEREMSISPKWTESTSTMSRPASEDVIIPSVKGKKWEFSKENEEEWHSKIHWKWRNSGPLNCVQNYEGTSYDEEALQEVLNNMQLKFILNNECQNIINIHSVLYCLSEISE